MHVIIRLSYCHHHHSCHHHNNHCHHNFSDGMETERSYSGRAGGQRSHSVDRMISPGPNDNLLSPVRWYLWWWWLVGAIGNWQLKMIIITMTAWEKASSQEFFFVLPTFYHGNLDHHHQNCNHHHIIIIIIIIKDMSLQRADTSVVASSRSNPRQWSFSPSIW